MTEGYCVRCRERVEMKKEEECTMKNGKHAIKGECRQCGAEMYKIKAESHEGMW